jgi:hypothetical protein
MRNFAVQSTGSDAIIRGNIKAAAQDKQNPLQKTSRFAGDFFFYGDSQT